MMIIIDHALIIINHRKCLLSKIQRPKLNGVIIVLKVESSHLEPHTPHPLLDEFTNSINVNCRNLNWVTLSPLREAISLSLLIQFQWIISFISIKRIDVLCIWTYVCGAFSLHKADPISCFSFCIDRLVS